MTRAAGSDAERLAIEQRKIRIASLISLPVRAITLAATYFVVPVYFEFPAELIDRTALTLQADLLIVLWVMIAVGIVSRSRLHSVQDIDAAIGGQPSRRLAIQIAFPQNTLEQAVIAIGTHLLLATLIEGGGAFIDCRSRGAFNTRPDHLPYRRSQGCRGPRVWDGDDSASDTRRNGLGRNSNGPLA